MNFKQKCTTCQINKLKLIGTEIKDIYNRRSPAYVMKMILNPSEMLLKNVNAIAPLKKFNNIIILNQNLSEEETFYW